MSRFKQVLKQEFTWLKLSYKFRWTHHPTCDPYQSQRFDFSGISLCQGCTILTVSALISFITTLILGIPIFLPLFILYIFALLGVAIIDGIGFGRNFKRLARISIGASLGMAFAQLLLLSLIQSSIILSLIISSFFGYRWFRSQKSSKDLCQTCPELKNAPRCQGVIRQYEANRTYQELIVPVIDEDTLRRIIARSESDSPNQVVKNKLSTKM
jgi:hypothetical protein